jgi:hypothetical protein
VSTWTETRGMPLRDYYAGLAMQGILAAPSDSVSQDLGPNSRANPERCAQAAVAMADALLIELGYAVDQSGKGGV